MTNRIHILRPPQWMVSYALTAYALSMLVVSLLYVSHMLPWYFMLAGIMAILLFFVGSRVISRDLSVLRIMKHKRFERQLFWVAMVPRVVFMLLLYRVFMNHFGNPFGFDNADSVTYDTIGKFVADQITHGDFHLYDRIVQWSGREDISDMGYGIYLGFIYAITGKSIMAVRLLKCVWSSLTVLFIYRLARRNFGEQTARVAAIFCALWPNFWYYCAVHLKESEMVFLSVLFVEQADQMLRSRQFTAWKVIPVLLIAALLFTFRTPLGLVALLALLFSLVMSSTRVVTWGKRVIVGLLAVALIGVVAGTRIEERANTLIEQVRDNEQQHSLEWRSQREHGNMFAKYAGSAVFAPMILTLPFPTMVRPFDGQDIQQLNHGGNFIKNIMSFFTILAIIMLLISGKWRDNLLPLSFMLGYLLVLTMSNFAHSERFHQPAMPFEFMFAAYGVGIALTKKKYKSWFTYWCMIMFVAAIAWNWFKMAGRGL